MKKTLPLILLSILIAGTPAHAQQAQPPGAGDNYEVRLTTLEDEMRSLNGRIEQLEFSQRSLTQNIQRMQSDIELRLSKLESAQAPAQSPAVASVTPMPNASTISPASASASPPAAVAPIAPAGTGPAAAETPVNGSLGSLTMQNGKVTGSVDNPQSPPLPAAPADYGLTPREQYDHAFTLLRQANYDEAEKAFKSFIDKNPRDKLIDNAKYWYGETLYVRGQFDESAVAFAEAYQQNPQGTKAPDSLLKLAMSLANINKVSDACTTLIELKSKFPTAPSAVRSRADEERNKLQCTSH